MAYSFISYRNSDVRLHDTEISICAFLIMSIANKASFWESARNQGFKEMFQEWRESIDYDGAGCIDLQLDAFLDTDDKVHLLFLLLEKAEKQLNVFEEFVPAAYLNEISQPSKLNYKDIKLFFCFF
ncbi:MAG: hypothetical protein AAFW67_03940 [Cyanobacteria bacterium J06638_38]